MDQLSGSVDNSTQNGQDYQVNSDNYDIAMSYGGDTESQVSDNDVMGDAVRDTQGKAKSQQQKVQQAIQKIKLADREYDPAELESLVKEVPNYKKGMHQAFERASKAEKVLSQVEQILSTSKDPFELLSRLNIPQSVIDQAVAKYADQRVKEHQMTPEQRQWEQDKREKAELQKQVEQHKKQQEQHYAQQLERHYVNEYDQQFQTQIVSKNLPYTSMDLREMASIISIGHSKGVDMDFATAAEQMLENRKTGYHQYSGELAKKDPQGNLVAKWLHPEALKAVRQYFMNQIKTPGQPVKRIQSGQPSSRPEDQSTMTPQQFRQYIKSR